MENPGIKIGTGVLTWPRSERVSDRYGCVALLSHPDCTDFDVPLTGEHGGIYGRLVAHIEKARESRHIGDIFRGVFPSTPDVGEWIVLGEGTYYQERKPEGPVVGLRPSDSREADWLDINALYRCHEQTVSLYFQPDHLA